MSADSSPVTASYKIRFGEWMNRGFQAYIDQWQNWLVQVLIAAGIGLAALACCILPAAVVAGPLVCGLHFCGLRAIRRQAVDASALRRGWETAGQSMIAFLGLQIMQILPAMILYAVFVGGWMAMMMSGSFVPPTARPVAPLRGPPGAIVVEDFTRPEASELKTANPRETAHDAVPENGRRSTPQAGSEMAPADAGIEVELFDPAVEQAGSVAAGPRVAAGRPVAIAPSVGIAFFAMIFVFYGLMFLGFLAMMAFAFWFGTKTMFVMPLIADRGCSFLEALTESWRLTSTRFWELLLTYALASIIAGIGVYFCYVGALATMPLYYTIIAAVYEAHALPQFTPQAEIVPAGPNAGPGA